MLVGKNIGLRKIEKNDLALLKEWRNRENYRKHFREYREINDDDQLKWYDKYVLNDPGTLMFAVVDLKTDEVIGACGLCYINWVQRNADLSLYIGKDNIYIDTNKDGFSWDCMNTLFKYAFGELNLHKIWTEIYVFDESKKELFEKFGMNQDGVLRDNYFYDGKFVNSYIYSILQEEFQKLN